MTAVWRNSSPPRQEEGDLDGLHDLVQNVALKSPGHPAPFQDDLDEAGESWSEKDEACRSPRDVGGAGHRDPDLRLPQRRRIVDPVTGHADDAALLLKLPDQEELVFWQNPREEVAVLPEGLHPSLTGIAGESQGLCHGNGGIKGVPGREPDPDTQAPDAVQRRAAVLSERVRKGQDPQKGQGTFWRPGKNGHRSLAPRGESGKGGGEKTQVREQGGRSLDHPDPEGLFFKNGLRPLRGGIEGGEGDPSGIGVRHESPAGPFNQDRPVERIERRIVGGRHGGGQQFLL